MNPFAAGAILGAGKYRHDPILYCTDSVKKLRNLNLPAHYHRRP